MCKCVCESIQQASYQYVKAQLLASAWLIHTQTHTHTHTYIYMYIYIYIYIYRKVVGILILGQFWPPG
jgi:hypothetical protein